MDEIQLSDAVSSEFVYDRRTKNICQDIIDPRNVPSYVTIVIVPPLQQLDPIWVAEKKLEDNRRKLAANSERKTTAKISQKTLR